MQTMIQEAMTEDGIYLYSFPTVPLNRNSQVIDEYIRVHGAHLRELPAHACVLNCVNLANVGLPPLSYLIQQINRYKVRFPDRATNYTVVIVDTTRLAPFISRVIDSLAAGSGDRVRLVLPAQQTEALIWLRQLRDAHYKSHAQP